MTPDLKHLIHAAAVGNLNSSARTVDYEAIVRAVLMALREPSEKALIAGLDGYDWDDGVSPDTVRGLSTAVIDYILGEPATA